jgi:GTPase
MRDTLAVLFYMARNQDVKIEIQSVKMALTPESVFTEVGIRRNILQGMKQGIKITMLGSEATGKSTLIGVLISG